MNSIKTRIWHGGLREIMNEGGAPTAADDGTRARAPGTTPVAASLPPIAGAKLIAGEGQAGELETQTSWVLWDDTAPSGDNAPPWDAALHEHAQALAPSNHTRRFGWWAERPRDVTAPSLSTTTRIMPIEQLLAPPEETRGAAAQHDTDAAREPRPTVGAAARVAAWLRRIFSHQGRLRTVLVVALVAAAAGVWSTHRTGPPAHAAPSEATAANAPSASTPSPPAATSPQGAASVGAATRRASSGAAERKPGSSLPATSRAPEPGSSRPATSRAPEPDGAQTQPAPGLERAAVDALAAGDYPRAQRLYETLAREISEPASFARAAHILAERTTSSAGEVR